MHTAGWKRPGEMAFGRMPTENQMEYPVTPGKNGR